MLGKFPIGFWNYPNINSYGPEEVTRWTKCGMTLNQSPRFDYAKNTKEQMLALLDECERQGMKLMLCIAGIEYRDALKDIDALRKTYIRAYEDFGKHPATYGFFVGDEPVGREENQACIDAYKIYREISPELTPFLNFNTYYPGFEEDILGGQNFTEWGKKFTEESGCSIICYDCYHQMNPGTEGLDSYFLNLKMYADMANAAGIELWTTLLSTAHYRYRVPSEDDLRWQLNTAVASGCRGILWFLFYGGFNNNYRVAPIDEFGEESETYRYLTRVQKRFHVMHGDLLYSLKHKKAYHFEKCYGTVDPFPQNTHKFIKRMNSVDKLPGILSFFEDDKGREYAVLVNNSPFESGRFEFVLDKSVKKIWRIEFNGTNEVDFAAFHHDALYHEEYEGIFAGVWMAPGQMEIFRFE